MTSRIGTAWIEVKPQLDQFSKDISAKMKSLSSSMSSWGKKLSVGLTLPIVGFFKAAVSEAEEAAKVARMTDAALRSTGNSAVLSAKKIAKLSTTVGKLVGQDNDAVQATANLVLNMVDLTRYGKNADVVLGQITETAYNYAAATGKSEQSAVRFFTVLANNPAKALSKLKDLGVINEKQVEQYKKLIETGDGLRVSQELLVKAQKKWKGVAYASLSNTEKLALKFGEMKEQVGKFLLPVVKKVSTRIGELVDKFNQLPKQTKKKLVEVVAMLAVLGPALVLLSKVASVLGGVWKVLGVGVAILTWLTYAVQLFLASVVGVGVSTAAAFGIVVAAILVVAGLAYLLIKNWDKVKKWFGETVKAIGQFFSEMWAGIKAKFAEGQRAFSELWDKIKSAAKAAFDAIKGVAIAVWDGILNALKAQLNLAIGLINLVIKGINLLPGVELSLIPKLAKGGIVSQPTLAVVGEAGPEAVIPLSQLGSVLGGGRLEIVDWRRGIATLSRELDHSTFVRGE